MKKLLLAAALLGGSASTALAADGCKFLLCMGAPNPMGISECAPTVKEVLRDLRKGKGLPTCQLANGLNSKTQGTWVSYTRAVEPTASCPNGYTQGRTNTLFYKGVRPANLNENSRVIPSQGGVMTTYYPSWNKDSGGSFSDKLNAGKYKTRACVKGNQNGVINEYRAWKRDRNGSYISITPRQEWWDDLVYMTPDGADYEFTFHVDNKPFSKHRF